MLVCDWNIRAWTLLEAIRGRQNIHILCKFNQVLSLRETLETVCREGSIDLAILFLTAQHLLPPEVSQDEWFLAKLLSDLKAQGFVSFEEASSLLSHRQASRPGDDVVIWSLLVGEQKFDSARNLWQVKLDHPDSTVNTGFLLSSAPRIKGLKGLGWAPSHPTLDQTAAGKAYIAADGHRSEKGEVREEGLRGECGVHKFEHSADGSPPYQSRILNLIQDPGSPPQQFRWIALLQPLAWDATFNRPVARRYRGNARGPLFAVCGSDDGREWLWRGVHEWDVEEPLPEFQVKNILLI